MEATITFFNHTIADMDNKTQGVIAAVARAAQVFSFPSRSSLLQPLPARPPPAPLVVACGLGSGFVFLLGFSCYIVLIQIAHIVFLASRKSPVALLLVSRAQVPEMDVVMTHAVGHMNTDRAWSQPGMHFQAECFDRTLLSRARL